MVEYIESIFDDFYGYVSFHGFGQKLMFPFSYMDSKFRYDELVRNCINKKVYYLCKIFIIKIR